MIGRFKVNKKTSVILWIIFLIIVAIIIFMIIPKYKDLSHEFSMTEARNIGAKLTSSSATNYTQRKADSSRGVAVVDCVDLTKIAGNELSKEYKIDNQKIMPDTTVVCVLEHANGQKLEFSAIGIN